MRSSGSKCSASCSRRAGVLQRERADRGAAQPGEVAADPERGAEVAGQRADVRPRRADHPYVEVGVVADRGRRRRARRSECTCTRRGSSVDLLAAPHPGVGALTGHLDRRDRRRDLVERVRPDPAAASGPGSASSPAAGVRASTSPSASSVRRCRAEPDGGLVRLVGAGQVAEQPGGTADADDEHAGGHRVEGAGVADPAGAGQPTHPGHHVVRGEARRACRRRRRRPRRRAARVTPVSAPRRLRVAARRPVSSASGVPVRVGVAGVLRARRRCAATSASDSRARASRSSMCRAFSGTRVEHERQRRRVPHAELAADLGPDQPGGALQGRRRWRRCRPPRRARCRTPSPAGCRR